MEMKIKPRYHNEEIISYENDEGEQVDYTVNELSFTDEEKYTLSLILKNLNLNESLRFIRILEELCREEKLILSLHISKTEQDIEDDIIELLRSCKKLEKKLSLIADGKQPLFRYDKINYSYAKDNKGTIHSVPLNVFDIEWYVGASIKAGATSDSLHEFIKYLGGRPKACKKKVGRPLADKSRFVREIANAFKPQSAKLVA